MIFYDILWPGVLNMNVLYPVFFLERMIFYLSLQGLYILWDYKILEAIMETGIHKNG